jgi:ABC-type nickel/cobalt efflux system permease component RcnA
MNIILQGIIVIILWVGMWGIIEMMIDTVAGSDRRMRFTSYFVLTLLGIFLIWITGLISI